MQSNTETCFRCVNLDLFQKVRFDRKCKIYLHPLSTKVYYSRTGIDSAIHCLLDKCSLGSWTAMHIRLLKPLSISILKIYLSLLESLEKWPFDSSVSACCTKFWIQKMYRNILWSIKPFVLLHSPYTPMGNLVRTENCKSDARGQRPLECCENNGTWILWQYPVEGWRFDRRIHILRETEPFSREFTLHACCTTCKEWRTKEALTLLGLIQYAYG